VLIAWNADGRNKIPPLVNGKHKIHIGLRTLKIILIQIPG
jgi:hypothetical protein